jgi:hypothetical protein
MGSTIATLDQSLATAAKLLRVLREAGLPDSDLRRPIDDSALRRRLVLCWQSAGYTPTTDQHVAQEILGKNFFGIEEWATLYRVNFSQKQLRAIPKFPWGEDILNSPCQFHNHKAIRETHLAYLGLDRYMGKPLTIMQWQAIHPATGQPRFFRYSRDCWYRGKRFATKPTCVFRWYLMPLEIVPKPECKTYQDQVAMLPAEYEVPFAVEEVTKDLLYHRKNGIFVNGSRYGRCQDVSSSGYRVIVGNFDSKGLHVGHWADDFRDGDIGLAASRKLPSLAA